MIAPDGFCVFRKDRCITKRDTTVKRGGGVCNIFRDRSRVVFKHVDLPPRFQNFEIVAVDILLGNSGTRLIVVYYPPDQTSDLGTCQLLLSALMYVGNPHLSVCIIGDFNLPSMDWSNNFTPNNDAYTEFLGYVNNNSLIQLVDFPTRGNNMLDVILTDDPQQISNIQSLPPIGNSDHLTIGCDLVIESDTIYCSRSADDSPSVCPSDSYNFSNFKYERADWVNIKAVLLTIDWYNIFSFYSTIEECWMCFCSILLNVFNLYIPSKPVRKQKRYGNNKRTFKRKY